MLFGVYAIGVGLERFLVEFLRRNDPVALGLTQPQWVSVGMMVVGAVLRGGPRGATWRCRRLQQPGRAAVGLEAGGCMTSVGLSD